MVHFRSGRVGLGKWEPNCSAPELRGGRADIEHSRAGRHDDKDGGVPKRSREADGSRGEAGRESSVTSPSESQKS